MIAAWLKLFRDRHVSLHGASASSSKRKRERPTPEVTHVTDDAVVIRITSFGFGAKPVLDRLLEENSARITPRTTLVLDLRGNGGGADTTYEKLIPLLYTGPIRLIGVDVLASVENADAWERILADIPEGEQETRARVRDIVQRIRANPGAFMSIAEDREITFPETLTAPRDIAIFIDRGCASSCEQFLLAARQSTKVRLYGQPSGGVLDYANVRRFPLPSSVRSLGIATTRSRRLPAQPVDEIGIPQHVLIDADELARLDGHALVETIRRLN